VTNGATTPIIRVFFVDDNVLAAKALERWFGSAPGFGFSGWAGDADRAVSRVVAEQPDVILLDLEMPGTDTIALIPRLLMVVPNAKVVMLSGHVRFDDIERTLRAGASGYISKDEPTSVIRSLVARAAGGECVLSPAASRIYLGS
jgi:DNA-binding NarL/FixJ family response regulator